MSLFTDRAYAAGLCLTLGGRRLSQRQPQFVRQPPPALVRQQPPDLNSLAVRDDEQSHPLHPATARFGHFDPRPGRCDLYTLHTATVVPLDPDLPCSNLDLLRVSRMPTVADKGRADRRQFDRNERQDQPRAVHCENNAKRR